MPIFAPNEADATKRRMACYVLKPDGSGPAPAGTDFTGCLWVAQGTGNFTAAAAGSFTNDNRPLSFSAITFTASATTDEGTATAHGLSNLDLVQVQNSGGALPTGLAASTNYWIIFVDANTVKFASSLANAIAGTAIDLTTNGSGTNQIISVAASVRYIDGNWTYEATQTELNFTGSEFKLLVSKPGVITEDTYTATMQADPMSLVGEGSNTYGDLMRLITGVLSGKVADFTTNTFAFKSLDGSKTRLTVTVDATGRTGITVGDLT